MSGTKTRITIKKQVTKDENCSENLNRKWRNLKTG
jgi:hypothetical protein